MSSKHIALLILLGLLLGCNKPNVKSVFTDYINTTKFENIYWHKWDINELHDEMIFLQISYLGSMKDYCYTGVFLYCNIDNDKLWQIEENSLFKCHIEENMVESREDNTYISTEFCNTNSLPNSFIIREPKTYKKLDYSNAIDLYILESKTGVFIDEEYVDGINNRSNTDCQPSRFSKGVLKIENEDILIYWMLIW